MITAPTVSKDLNVLTWGRLHAFQMTHTDHVIRYHCSKLDLRRETLSSPESLREMQTLRSNQEQLNQNLHFNKMHRWTLKSEDCCVMCLRIVVVIHSLQLWYQRPKHYCPFLSRGCSNHYRGLCNRSTGMCGLHQSHRNILMQVFPWPPRQVNLNLSTCSHSLLRGTQLHILNGSSKYCTLLIVPDTGCLY